MPNTERRVDRLEAADLERRIAERWLVKWSRDLTELRDLAGAPIDPLALDVHFQSGGYVDVSFADVDISRLEPDDAGTRAGYVYEVLDGAPILRIHKRAA